MKNPARVQDPLLEAPAHPESAGWRRWLLGMALGTLVTLWLLPATGWILHEQLRMQVVPRGWKRDPKAAARLLKAAPSDYTLQLAAARQREPGPEPLRALLPRFPDNASLYANILRTAIPRPVLLHRREEYELFGRGSSAAAAVPAPHQLDQLAEFDRDAAAGERLDPENAYFPLMRAVGLFAAHRDGEALDAVRRAGAKPRWEDYCLDEAAGAWLMGEVAGRPGALGRAGDVAATLLPHCRELLAAARMAVHAAAGLERAGRTDDGLAIRRAVARCGSLIRTQGRLIVVSLVGMNITGVAGWRVVAGLPPGPPFDFIGDRQWALMDAYRRHLERAGYPKDARWVRAEAEAGTRTRALAAPTHTNHVSNAPLSRLVLWWLAGVALLGNTLWVLISGAVATLGLRRSIIGERRPLPTPIVIGWLGLLAVTTFLTTRGLAELVEVARGLFIAGFPVQERLQGAARGEQAALVAVVLAVPGLLALVLGTASLVLRVPLTVGLARGFRGAALPVACCLVILYGGVALATARQEARVSDGLRRVMQHEGRYVAELAGEEWPGAPGPGHSSSRSQEPPAVKPPSTVRIWPVR